MDQLAAMRVFARVADLGSFTAAAEALGLSRAMTSTQVAALEKHFRVRLLNRTTRSLSLTEEGRAFHARCVQILAEIDEAETAVTDLLAAPRGTLRVAAAVAFFNHEEVVIAQGLDAP